MKLQPGHEIANRRTDGRTDGRTDRQTDGQTDDGDHNIIRPFGRIKSGASLFYINSCHVRKKSISTEKVVRFFMSQNSTTIE